MDEFNGCLLSLGYECDRTKEKVMCDVIADVDVQRPMT